jgi:hypothetical protein
MIVCAIHQPNFFPWLGYFDKVSRAEKFILLDDVAYPKSGSGAGSWCNRVKINIQSADKWIGCPIRRESGIQLIKNIKIDDSQPWRKKLLRTLELNYKRSPNFLAIMPQLEALVLYPTDSLTAFNINAIKNISHLLKCDTDFILQSALNVSGQSTALLVNLTKAVGANAYLCGSGATSYQEDHLFAENSLELIYQNFMPKPYGDAHKFIPGLSVIDYLMNSSSL